MINSSRFKPGSIGFKKDIVIDMVCFRRRGHNETDDPSQTQPKMYQAVASHPGIKKLYQDRLIEDNVITLDECKNFEKKYRETIELGESVAHNLATEPNESMWFDWSRLRRLSRSLSYQFL